MISLLLAVTVSFPAWVIPVTITILIGIGTLILVSNVESGHYGSGAAEVLFLFLVALLLVSVTWVVFLLWLYYHTHP